MCKIQKCFITVQTPDTLNQNFKEVIEEKEPGFTKQYMAPGQETNSITSNQRSSGWM